MNVEMVPGEQGVFLVQSRGRPEIKHRVDLQYVAEGMKTAKPTCSCEAYQANKATMGKPCPHIFAVIGHELKRLGLVK